MFWMIINLLAWLAVGFVYWTVSDLEENVTEVLTDEETIRKEEVTMDKEAEVDILSTHLPVVICPECKEIRDEHEMEDGKCRNCQ